MKTDYKFNRIKRTDTETVVTVTFYEGDNQDVYEEDPQGVWDTVNKYVRSSILRADEFTYSGNKTDAELVTLMNTELATDGTRDSITEQA